MYVPIAGKTPEQQAIEDLLSERDSLQRRLDEALALIEEARKQEPVGKFVCQDYTGWTQLHQDFEQDEDAIPLYSSPPIASVPEGMVLVPKEPTEEMKKAAEDSFAEATDLGDIYKSMLSAAK